jgi:hypothetical protein
VKIELPVVDTLAFNLHNIDGRATQAKSHKLPSLKSQRGIYEADNTRKGRGASEFLFSPFGS